MQTTTPILSTTTGSPATRTRHASTTTRPATAHRLRSFVRGGAHLAASAAAVSLFAVGLPLASATAAPEVPVEWEELIAELPAADSPPPEVDVEQAFPDDDDPVEPPSWGPDQIKPCEVNCNPGGDEDGGNDGGDDGGNDNGGNDDGGGGNDSGSDDGTDDVPEYRTPLPTRIDAGEGSADGDYLWLALGGVLSAVGLSTLGYRTIRNRQ